MILPIKDTHIRGTDTSAIGEQEFALQIDTYGQLDLSEVATSFAQKWYIWPGIILLSALLTPVFMNMLDRGYRAEATIVIREQENSSPLSIIPGFQNSGGDSTFVAVVNSRSLAERLARDESLLALLGLPAVKLPLTQRVENNLSEFAGLPSSSLPTSAESVHSTVKSGVQLDTKSGIVKISFSNADPEVSSTLLSKILEESDELMKIIKLDEKRQRLIRLEQMLANVGSEPDRQSLITLHNRLSSSLAADQSLVPFAFTIIDSPSVWSQRNRPSLLLVFAGLVVITSAFAATIILAPHLIRRRLHG
ncbi:GumC domain-containing protein [Indioceanicola profundi]|uniref:hypothetical protein n=1 Tax=Indioceanicola profundi TaxID=2220096 RepID=UPI000E6A9561|nr:hypothetical protein [Indioceanicola profundi]